MKDPYHRFHGSSKGKLSLQIEESRDTSDLVTVVCTSGILDIFCLMCHFFLCLLHHFVAALMIDPIP